MSRRIGLLGGTFDPIHAGHLDLARWCAAELRLDEVRFLTAHRPPHKPPANAGAHHRHAMVALATAPHPDFIADPRELARPGPSYTIDTLEELSAERPGADLVFLVGADSLRDLRTWRRLDDILRLAVVAGVGRDGVDLDAAARGVAGEIASGRVIARPHRPPPWRSSELRRLIQAGAPPPPGAIPDAVASYIVKNSLYRGPSPGRDEGPSPGPRRNA